MRKMFERRSPRWWVLSVAAHVVFIALLAQVMFRYPLGQIVGIPKRGIAQERLHYIAIPQTTETSEAANPPAAASAAPAPLRAPTDVPTALPVLTPPDSSRSHSAGGTGTGDNMAGSGAATGISPRLPDARIALSPNLIVRTPRSVAEDVDSLVMLAIGVVRDSLAIAAAERKPGDWTVKDKGGGTWGWDPNGNIRLGKFTIPGALLALLPLNNSGPVSPIERRSLAYIRRDILENAQRSINEDEFRAAVKRIRERKERERRQQQLAEQKAETRSQP